MDKSSTRPLVIVVDDFDDGRELFAELLELAGFATAQACDGLEAMDLLARLEPDLLVLDLSMPRLDGFEVAARVRRDPLRCRVPIVAITGRRAACSTARSPRAATARSASRATRTC